jgi:hypothetical protein
MAQNCVECQALGEGDKNLGCIGRVEMYVINLLAQEFDI